MRFDRNTLPPSEIARLRIQFYHEASAEMVKLHAVGCFTEDECLVVDRAFFGQEEPATAARWVADERAIVEMLGALNGERTAGRD